MWLTEEKEGKVRIEQCGPNLCGYSVQNGERVLPELATSYLDRGNVRPGMIAPGDVVVNALEGIGWEWGGDWTRPVDYMHFSAENR